MGADEKHAATYHGTEYTPTTDELRDSWVDGKLYHLPQATDIALVPTVQAEFNRWLEQIRAEAKAEALNEAYNYGLGWAGHVLHRWLRDRANQYKEEQ